MIFLIFPTFLLFQIFVSAQAQAKPDQIIEIFRHGARGPLHDYDPSWKLSEYGALTPAGMRQQYVLGKVLAEKYSHLLGADYDYNEIYMLSDSTPRCIQSALAHLYGIYINTGPALKKDYPRELAVPPYKDPLVKSIVDTLSNNEALRYNYLPNVISLIDPTKAYIFKPNGLPYCPNSIIWEEQNLKDAQAQHGLKIFADTLNNINKRLSPSQQITTLKDIKGIGEVTMCDLADNRVLPYGLGDDPQLVTNITYAYAWAGFHIWGGQEIQRQLYGFGLIDSIIQQLTAFREGKDFNRVAMYSGHDSNLYAILAAFGVLTEDCLLENFKSYTEDKTLKNPTCYFPFFASNIMIELYNTTNSPSVKFYYNNEVIPLCKGQASCTLDEFITFARNATGNINLIGFLKKCGSPNTSTQQSLNEPIAQLLKETGLKPYQSSDKMIIMGLVTLCALLLAKMVYDNKKNAKIIRVLRGQNGSYNELNA